MSRLLVSIFLFFILLNPPSISHGQDQTTTKILLFGDSIVAGYNLTQFEMLDHQLEKILKEKGYLVDVINAGISGDTTAGGLNRIKAALKQYNPDIIIIALGGNDLLRGFSPRIVQHNVDAMVRIAKEYGSYVILSDVEAPSNYGIEYQQQFNAIYPEVAKKYDVARYPFLIKEIYTRGMGRRGVGLMQSDGIHPTGLGIKSIAEDLAKYFLKKLRIHNEHVQQSSQTEAPVKIIDIWP